ncbi:MAG: hypothetical protein L6R38_005192 [Xanthoria sp. 2 TBL-2021]|nr:MAG: hypothetical protein L6R38_005192 [Xanthoria sp. 2 TBL-2021]
MPTASKAPVKRGHPAFKPPRPPRSKPTRSKPPPKRKSAPATNIESSSGSDDEIASHAAEKSTDSEIDVEPSSATAAGPSNTQDPPPMIPPKLITRILYHHLEKDEGDTMKIGREANTLVGKYLDTFVREAIARAAFERNQADEATGTGDGFLEVEDLEKLVPQLLLDF